jgi:hypothetical protein
MNAVRGAALAIVLLVGSGCGKPEDSQPAVDAKVNEPASREPGEIELTSATVTFSEPNIARFEVQYRFTKGKPDKYYLCEISFPGTPNHGAKPMEKWELKSEGTIRDGIVLSKPPVTKFEIRISEAWSPQDGYKKISNVLSGAVQ